MIEIVRAAVVAAAAPPAFAERWTDVATWPTWDPSLRSASLDGPCRVGARGRVRPRGGPPTRFTVTRVVRSPTHAELVDVSRLPLAALTFTHRAEAVGTGARVEHLVTLDGPLADLWVRVLGRGLRRTVGPALQRLVDQLGGPA